MKTTMKGLIAVLLLIASESVVLAGDAPIPDEPLPPDVKKLIGMTIPDMEPGGKGGIPGWHSKRGTLLGKQQFGVEELYRQNVFIFLVSRLDEKSSNLIVLDAQVLPQHLLSYYEKSNELIFEPHSKKYAFESQCYRTPGELVVGLIRAEHGKEDCTHKTRQVKRAWKIDSQSGRISEIPPSGVYCYYMDSEYSCD